MTINPYTYQETASAEVLVRTADRLNQTKNFLNTILDYVEHHTMYITDTVNLNKSDISAITPTSGVGRLNNVINFLKSHEYATLGLLFYVEKQLADINDKVDPTELEKVKAVIKKEKEGLEQAAQLYKDTHESW